MKVNPFGMTEREAKRAAEKVWRCLAFTKREWSGLATDARHEVLNERARPLMAAAAKLRNEFCFDERHQVKIISFELFQRICVDRNNRLSLQEPGTPGFRFFFRERNWALTAANALDTAFAKPIWEAWGWRKLVHGFQRVIIGLCNRIGQGWDWIRQSSEDMASQEWSEGVWKALGSKIVGYLGLGTCWVLGKVYRLYLWVLDLPLRIVEWGIGQLRAPGIVVPPQMYIPHELRIDPDLYLGQVDLVKEEDDE